MASHAREDKLVGRQRVENSHVILFLDDLGSNESVTLSQPVVETLQALVQVNSSEAKFVRIKHLKNNNFYSQENYI